MSRVHRIMVPEGGERVPIGKRGRIVGGPIEAKFSTDPPDTWFVTVEDDSRSTGGFLVLFANESGTKGYDDWVENLIDLDEYFREGGWVVEW